MARLLLALALLGITLTGCLGAPSEEAAEPSATEGSAGQVTQTELLGRQSGTNVLPSSYPFEVVVPIGGAQDVRWQLTVQTSGNEVLHSISGPGCGNGIVSNVNVQIGVVGSTTWGGFCDDLPAGSHTFTAVMNGPALSFEATVLGTVTGAR